MFRPPYFAKIYLYVLIFFISPLQDYPKIIPSRFSVLLFVCHLTHTALFYSLFTATLFACRFFFLVLATTSTLCSTLFHFPPETNLKTVTDPSRHRPKITTTKTLKNIRLVGVAFDANNSKIYTLIIVYSFLGNFHSDLVKIEKLRIISN